MTRIARPIFVPLLLMLATVPAGAQGPADESVDDLVKAVGQGAVEAGAVGLSIGVARRGRVLCTKGFGTANLEWNAPVDERTVFRIGSVTKEFTAAAILLLAEDQAVSLDDPLNKFLPDYPGPAGKATIRQLLQHTSGVQDFTRLPSYRKDRFVDASPQEVLGRFQHLPLESEPGSKHRYCNSGYFLLGLVVEKASGKTYREFLEERLLGPLALKRTFCDGNSQIIPRRAAGYSKWNGKRRNAPSISLRQTVGAGNLASTAGDLLKWQHALVSGELLDEQSVGQLMSKGTLGDGTEFNYGIGVRLQSRGGREAVAHAGGISGFRSDVAHYPASGYTIVVLANSDRVNATRISDQLARRLHAQESGTP